MKITLITKMEEKTLESFRAELKGEVPDNVSTVSRVSIMSAQSKVSTHNNISTVSRTIIVNTENTVPVNRESRICYYIMPP